MSPTTKVDDGETETAEFCMDKLTAVVAYSIPPLVRHYTSTGNDEVLSVMQDAIDQLQSALDKMRSKASTASH